MGPKYLRWWDIWSGRRNDSRHSPRVPSAVEMQRDGGHRVTHQRSFFVAYAYRNRPIRVVAEGFGGDHFRSNFSAAALFLYSIFNLIAQLRI